MAEIALGFRSAHRVETDGTHTVTIQIDGLPTLALAQGVSDWMHRLVRENASQIGRLDPSPPKAQ